MRRVLTFLVVAALLVAFAWWLAGLPGSVSATIGDWSLTLPTAWAALGLLVAFAAVYIVVRLLVALVRLPSRSRRMQADRARRGGDRAVTRTLLALAGGDSDTAQREAARSRRLLGDTPQTLLLAAYAGRQAGREDEADAAFRLLAARKDAAFLGLRGLLQGAVARGDTAAALALAQEAERANPGMPWLRSERAKLASDSGDWGTALSLAAPDDPVAAWATAAAEHAADPAEALRLAKQAFRADPSFTPAALTYARLLREAGRERRAQAVLRTAWGEAPHPELAELALETSTDPAVRTSRVNTLAEAAPSNPETYLLRAQSELDLGNLPQARREAEAAQAAGLQGRRVWRLLAAIAERDGDPAGAQEAFRRAAEAPPDPQWRCAQCGTAYPHWQAKCDACGATGRISWGEAAARPAVQLIGVPGETILP